MEELNRKAAHYAVEERNEEIVLNFLKENVSISTIARITNLSEEKILQIQQEALVES